MVQQPQLPSAPSPRPFLAAAALLAVVLSAVAAGATTRPAAAASGTSPKAHATLTLSGSAGKRLRAAGVKVAATRKATATRTKLTLPVTAAVVGSTAAVGLDGAIAFRAGKRQLRLTGLRLAVSKRRTVQVLANVVGDRVAVLTGKASKRALTLDRFRSTAAFTATSVALTPPAARLLRKKLRLRRTPTGTLGALTLVAARTDAPTTPGAPTTTPPGPTTPATTPTTPTTPAPGPKVCEPTAPGTSAVSESGWDLAPPASAVAIASACITWHPRDSWTNYVNTGEGATTSNGATADPPNTACGTGPLPRDFHFQFHRGWFDPATGQTALQYDGSVRYRYTLHTIDLDFQNPEIQLGGPAPQATFRAGAGGRSSVLDLAPASPWPAQCAADPGPRGSHDPGGVRGARTYERLHATVSSGAAAMFAGAGGSYPAGSDFGWLSVSFTPTP